MNAPQMVQPEWISYNQNVMVAEFARLKARLRGEDESEVCVRLEQVSKQSEGLVPAIDHITERFALTAFERDLLLLMAGVEMDSEIASLCSSEGPNAHGPWASFGLALAVLSEPHWSALAPTRPLRFWRLIETVGEESLTSCRLHIDERVLHYLAGVGYLEPRLHPLLQNIAQPAVIADGQLAVVRDIIATVERSCQPPVLLQLLGNDADGKRDVAAFAATHLGLQLYGMNSLDLPASPYELEALIVLWQREVALLDCALLIECNDTEPTPAVRKFAEQIGGLTLVAIRAPMILDRSSCSFRIDKPDPGDQLRLWQQILGTGAARFAGAIKDVSTEFRLSRRDIQRVGAELEQDNSAEGSVERTLRQTCLRLQGRRINDLAQRIEPAAHWDDLILPETQKAVLHQIVVHLRNRCTVYNEWGFAARSSRGLGISALFAGESGTGKTMAAEVMANALHFDLYRIDLSAVVSKYIGETEKKLARVFDAAEDSSMILLFDEADALFGKRSEVKDSHDRYANIEVSYLLQRMETYRGLAILTTNQKAALDTAFHRRLRFIVNFPFPDANEREAIWRGMFPLSLPTEGLDYARLARLQGTGGNIRNIALCAAFLAAEANQPVTMALIQQAAHAEASKRERPLGDAETRGWI